MIALYSHRGRGLGYPWTEKRFKQGATIFRRKSMASLRPRIQEAGIFFFPLSARG